MITKGTQGALDILTRRNDYEQLFLQSAQRQLDLADYHRRYPHLLWLQLIGFQSTKAADSNESAAFSRPLRECKNRVTLRFPACLTHFPRTLFLQD